MKDYEKFILCEVNPSKEEIINIVCDRVEVLNNKITGINERVSVLKSIKKESEGKLYNATENLYNDEQDKKRQLINNIEKHKELLEKIDKLNWGD